MAKSFPHNESLLQFIWANLLFDTSSLHTLDGQAITIQNQGELNISDGPDFKNASIAIDGLIWHGAVELHTQANYWNQHKHQDDPNYNQVILHVIIGGSQQVICENGHQPPTLNLLPYLPQELSTIVENYNKENELLCSGNLIHLNSSALDAQLSKAKREYFEKKVEDFYSFFPAHIPPSLAWKHAYILSFFDGLGISQNRNSMQQVASICLDTYTHNLSFSDFALLTHEKLFELEKAGTIKWNHKGVRPANHPGLRIDQGLSFAFQVLSMPKKDFVQVDTLGIWENICLKSSLGMASTRMRLLFHIVHLPAMYSLGHLVQHKKLQKEAFNLWSDGKTKIPSSIRKLFPTTQKGDSSHLGFLHQYNAYCKPRKCSECFVLKSAIQS